MATRAATAHIAPVASLTDERPRRGRPRNTDIDERILVAASEVYAERGWTGFNFDVVARRAGVSKDAMYRRYDDPVVLLLSSWSGSQKSERRSYESALPDDADVRDYLVAIARDHFAMFTRENGFDHLRVYVEAKHHPEVLKAFSERQSRDVSRVRRRVRAAMDAGILPMAASPTAVIDALVGGVAMHVMATPPQLRKKMLKESRKYLAELVDLVLRGCGYDFIAVPQPKVRANGR
jgi:AcrR family transcriptional regulator